MVSSDDGRKEQLRSRIVSSTSITESSRNRSVLPIHGSNYVQHHHSAHHQKQRDKKIQKKRKTPLSLLALTQRCEIKLVERHYRSRALCFIISISFVLFIYLVSRDKPEPRLTSPMPMDTPTKAKSSRIDPNDFSQYRNSKIMEQNCSMTILLMEPKIGNQQYSSQDTVWFSIESVVSNLHDDILENVCILIQTSLCNYKGYRQMLFDKNLQDQLMEESKRKANLRSVMNEYLLENALPVFKSLIQSGNVRITILDHKKYSLRACYAFINPSYAWMNYEYWSSEFLSQDSDFVMLIQPDVVMCNSQSNLISSRNAETTKNVKKFHPKNWNDLAYVGGIWPPDVNMEKYNNPEPIEGNCKYLPKMWKLWHFYDNNREDQPFSQQNGWCDGKSGIAPLGNGGFSLRSREWLRKAIEYCPDAHYSGYSKETLSEKRCVVPRGLDINEDLYFATVLRGINAPLPNAFEASLFGKEMVGPEDALELYYGYSFTRNDTNFELELELEKMVEKRWGYESIEYYREMRLKNYIVPLGFHKPFWYFRSETEINTRFLDEHCPLLTHFI